ncbi:MAG TPA: hypothetical protein PKC45_05670 [Gemmatales bacterium]|nr:hypothetical protein [Gemmatales bacterium]
MAAGWTGLARPAGKRGVNPYANGMWQRLRDPEVVRFGLALVLALTAWPALYSAPESPWRQAWWAALVAGCPLLLKLRIFTVATPDGPSKIAAVSWRMMRRMGLVLGLALALFLLTEGLLTPLFWVWLVGFYQGTIILDCWLLWSEWDAESPPRSPDQTAH